MQLQNKQASRSFHVQTTMQPLSKITVCEMYGTRLNTYLWNNKSKRVALATEIFLLLFAYPGIF